MAGAPFACGRFGFSVSCRRSGWSRTRSRASKKKKIRGRHTVRPPASVSPSSSSSSSGLHSVETAGEPSPRVPSIIGTNIPPSARWPRLLRYYYTLILVATSVWGMVPATQSSRRNVFARFTSFRGGGGRAMDNTRDQKPTLSRSNPVKVTTLCELIRKKTKKQKKQKRFILIIRRRVSAPR